MSDVTNADIDALLTDIGAFGFADLPSDQRRHRTAELLDLSETALITLRARLAAAESRLREYEDAPVVGHVRLIDTKLKAVMADCFIYHTDKDAELIIRPRGGKGE